MTTVRHEFSGYKARQNARDAARSMRERGFKNVKQHKEGRTRVAQGDLPAGIAQAERGR